MTPVIDASPQPVSPIAFTNFTPGIADNPSVNYPREQATRTNTFRCMALKRGALVPAFRNDFSRDGTLFEAGNPAGTAGYLVSGIYVVSPLLPAAGTTTSDGRVHELWIATEYGTVVPHKKRKLQRVRLFENPVVVELVIDQDSATASENTNGWGATFGQTRANSGTPTDPGIPVVIIGWGSLVAGFPNVWEYPDDTAPTLGVPYVVSAVAGLVSMHQGRIVIRTPTAYAHGINGLLSTTEDLRWTNVNNPHVLSTIQQFYPENTDGYGFVVSMTANELFLLKQSGALMITGDLDNPIVINLPRVPGGGPGVRTPLGFIYRPNIAINGLYVWAGGDSAEQVCESMNPNFTDAPLEGLFLGQSAQWYDASNFVFMSNNFFFDTDTQSLWRLEDESVVQFQWMTGAMQFVYGARGRYTHASAQAVWGYNLTLGATSYSWQSHPIWESVDRVLTIREIELIAQGQGTITVTLTSFSGATDNVVITLANTGFPERFRRPFAIQGQYVQARIQADSGSGSVNAPTVFSLVLHPDSRARNPAA